MGSPLSGLDPSGLGPVPNFGPKGNKALGQAGMNAVNFVTPRALGVLQAAGGLGVAIFGAGCLAAPEPFVTKVGGVILVVVGLDNFTAGGQTVISGKPTPTVTATVVSGGLQAVGVSPANANGLAEGTNFWIL